MAAVQTDLKSKAVKPKDSKSKPVVKAEKAPAPEPKLDIKNEGPAAQPPVPTESESKPELPKGIDGVKKFDKFKTK